MGCLVWKGASSSVRASKHGRNAAGPQLFSPRFYVRVLAIEIFLPRKIFRVELPE